MRIFLWIGLGLALTLCGCQRRSYTEADVQEAIAERQGEFQTEIERGVRAAPPVEVDTSPTGSTPSGGGSAPSGGEVNLPPPNRYDAPPPASRDLPTQSPPAAGDVKLDPQTGQYGIQPPGAPETYTIPLDRQQGQ